jgi:fatty acid desaturase
MATQDANSNAPEKNARLSLQRRQAAGIAILIVVIAILSIWRAGLASVFPAGWWRFW